MAGKGYVYILEVKDLTLPVCKIGMTRRFPIERCAEINKSSTGDFLWAVSSWVIVEDPGALESLVHRALGDFRQKGREFFGLPPDEAYAALKGVISANAITELADEPTHEAEPNLKPLRYRKSDLLYAELFEAFAFQLGVKARPFGQTQRPVFGVSDGNQGVQYSLAVFQEERKVCLGVNLEGLAYGGKWPIAQFLINERQNPTIKSLPLADDVFLRLTRDAWQCASRPSITEEHITPYPEISCAALTEASWVEFVETSLSCLDAERQFQGRSRQMVTRLSSQARSMMEVSPHLTIWTPIPAESNGLSDGFERLKPFHDWVRKRSGSPV